MLAAYRRLLTLRRTLPPLQRGSFRWIARTGDVLAYARDSDGESVVVAINFSGRPAEVAIAAADAVAGAASVRGKEAALRTIYSTVSGRNDGGPAGAIRPSGRLRLAGHEAVLLVRESPVSA